MIFFVTFETQSLPHTPLIPAKAGIQSRQERLSISLLDSRLRGNERMRAFAAHSASWPGMTYSNFPHMARFYFGRGDGGAPAGLNGLLKAVALPQELAGVCVHDCSQT
ncbi:MAG TPA: hypothetical protein VKD19_13945 [Pseudolabrys sp.]|nr:hypothetical protein [Pseudolabrys sp.]